jgi:nicotinamide mononucleotide adenylyltransferase
VNIIPIGSAHGRFQPCHNGHIEYLLAAKARCEFLWVGITQYVSAELQQSPVDSHRAERVNNPLTYFERTQMLRDVLVEAGVPEDKFAIAPFPIETPHLLHEFLTTDVPVVTTIYDDWNRHKVRVLKKLGYRVIVLWERAEKAYSGQEIRELIHSGSEEWVRLVPQATAVAVRRYRLRDRLQAKSGPRGTA